jgi:hypothetical protein
VQHVPSKAEARHLARLEAFDYDVGAFREVAQDGHALGMAKVERQGTFVEVVEPEEQAAVLMGQVIDERPDTSRRVAARRLDFDHVGAHVGEQAGAQMPFEVGEIENA